MSKHRPSGDGMIRNRGKFWEGRIVVGHNSDQSPIYRYVYGKTQKELIEKMHQKHIEYDGIELSGGESQKLSIARAIYKNAPLYILDEPTSALDPIGRKEILDILLKAKEQTTVLFSTHILSDVERICTDVAFLNDGVICLQGKLEDIKSSYRTDEYIVEADSEEDAAKVLQFIEEQKISITKIERKEPTLESLFMEVTAK